MKNPFCVTHRKGCKLRYRARLGLHNGSKNHRAVEGSRYVGGHLYLAQTEGLTELDGGDITAYAAGDILNGALNGHLVYNLVNNTTHANTHGSTGELNGNLGLNNGVGGNGLEIEVHGAVGQEAALYILNHGKNLGTIEVKLNENAVGISSVEESTNVGKLSLNVDVAFNSRSVDNAGYKTLSAQSVELTGTDNLALRHIECKSRHNDETMLEIVFIGVLPTSVRGIVTRRDCLTRPQGTGGRTGCHYC